MMSSSPSAASPSPALSSDSTTPVVSAPVAVPSASPVSSQSPAGLTTITAKPPIFSPPPLPTPTPSKAKTKAPAPSPIAEAPETPPPTVISSSPPPASEPEVLAPAPSPISHHKKKTRPRPRPNTAPQHPHRRSSRVLLLHHRMMLLDLPSSLELPPLLWKKRYVDFCKTHTVLPNASVLLWLSKADLQKHNYEECTIMVELCKLGSIDVSPLVDLLQSASNSPDVDAINILLHQATCFSVNEEHIVSLISAADQKLHTIHLHDLLSSEHFLRHLFQNGAACRTLALSSPSIQKLDNIIRFPNLQNLNLDFCTSLTTLHKDCFSLMPSLKSLSMCGTRIFHLWTTSAALSRAASLVELRFQNCLCCKGTGPCPSYPVHKGESFPFKFSSHHPSPVCFEKCYREFMVTSLPQLKVLDNVQIGEEERRVAWFEFSNYYESLPYRRQEKENLISVLHNRELGSCAVSSKLRRYPHIRTNHHYFLRSICAAKLPSSSSWPFVEPISDISHVENRDGIKNCRPRQFEYHPVNSSLMAFGTLDGEVVVVNHENRKVIAYMPTLGAMDRVLGLCWLKKHPSKVLAGSDSGSLRLFDMNHASQKESDSCSTSCGYPKFDSFQQLTSVHINSTDEKFLVSGYTKKVALYDIECGKQLQLYTDMHDDAINVAKFAHHSPFTFVTSSFDQDIKLWDLRQKMTRPCYISTSSRGNVMVCFSPDDHYLLVSAVDNAVKQLLATDGRLHMDFGIASTGSPHNYTRSYYMNGTDYVISGSSDENVVRLCCSQTGRRLMDIYLEGRGHALPTFIQSLRGDPFREFNMSILAAYTPSSSKCKIIKVNLLKSNELTEEDHHGPQQLHLSSSLGG